MSSLMSAFKRLSALALLGGCPLLAVGQVAFSTAGGEYSVVGSVPGDQVFPSVALNPFGGYVVWQDNYTDGDGFGISAQRLNRSLSGSYGTFRVNEQGAGDQTLPQVALLNGGGAIFAWQSSVGPTIKVYARFAKADGTFATGDVLVSSYATDQQVTPVVAALPDGNALVVWASGGQDGSMLGIFAQRFSPTGAKIGSEFQVNQSTLYNQRNPTVAVLANGNVVVGWISEAARGVTQNITPTGQRDPTAGLQVFDIDVVGRIFQPDGTAVTDEFKANSSGIGCANPCVNATATGFVLAWSGKPVIFTSTTQATDSWDIYARPFSISGVALAADARVNTYTSGNQYAPKSAYANGLEFVTWTSRGQDGSGEGVVGRLLAPTGEPGSREFRVNTTTIGSQMYPTVTANGSSDFLCVWSSFVGGVASMDLFAQRYTVSQTFTAPPAPFVSALSQSKLSVSWPDLSGYAGVQYLVFMDGSTTPIAATGNSWTATNLQAGSTHSFRIAYKLADGTQSALSDPVSGQTWGEDGNFDGLPDDWQARYWGSDSSKWPAANVDSDGDGASNLQEFLAGTNPIDATSVLRTRIVSSSQGFRLEWNTEPGSLYQVQSAGSDLTWSDVGSVRFAAGTVDSIPCDGGSNLGLYRVIRVR